MRRWGTSILRFLPNQPYCILFFSPFVLCPLMHRRKNPSDWNPSLHLSIICLSVCLPIVYLYQMPILWGLRSNRKKSQNIPIPWGWAECTLAIWVDIEFVGKTLSFELITAFLSTVEILALACLLYISWWFDFSFCLCWQFEKSGLRLTKPTLLSNCFTEWLRPSFFYPQTNILK